MKQNRTSELVLLQKTIFFLFRSCDGKIYRYRLDNSQSDNSDENRIKEKDKKKISQVLDE